MSALILKFDKGFLDCVDSVDTRFTAVLPPPRSREIYPGLFTKIGQGNDIKRVQTFHDSFIKALPIMGMVKQWTYGLHSLSSLAFTQYYLLTYPSRMLYTTCVSAICQGAEDDIR